MPGPLTTAPVPAPSTVTSEKFIDGLPMNPATNRLTGLSYRVCGVPTC